MQRCDPYDRTDMRVDNFMDRENRVASEDGKRGWKTQRSTTRWRKSKESTLVRVSVRIEAIATPEKHSLILGENIVIQVRV